MHEWMGAVFYRGVNPSAMGYAELRYWNRWHEKIAAEELAAVNRAQGK